MTILRPNHRTIVELVKGQGGGGKEPIKQALVIALQIKARCVSGNESRLDQLDGGYCNNRRGAQGSNPVCGFLLLLHFCFVWWIYAPHGLFGQYSSKQTLFPVNGDFLAP